MVVSEDKLLHEPREVVGCFLYHGWLSVRVGSAIRIDFTTIQAVRSCRSVWTKTTNNLQKAFDVRF